MGHPHTWASNMCLLYRLHPPSCPPFYLLVFAPLLHFPFPIHHIHIFFPPWLSIIVPYPYSNVAGLSFLSSAVSVIPPPTLSQVKRFLPCFSSNWRMRCMSWLHCCFIRKQLFTLSIPPPSCFFSSSLRHSLCTLQFFPSYLSMLFFVYRSVCTARIDVNWSLHRNRYSSPKWDTYNLAFSCYSSEVKIKGRKDIIEHMDDGGIVS